MPNPQKQCKHLEQVCNKLNEYESYRKFIVYKDKVLAMGNDSLEKTIAIALSLCFICAILVSFSAVALKPMQIYNKDLDMKKNILDVAGLLEEGKPAAIGRRDALARADLAEVVVAVEVLAVRRDVVEHAVEDDPDAGAVGRAHQLGELLVCAEERVDAQVVLRVIGVVAGSVEDGVEVDRRDAQALQVADAPGDAGQVADLKSVV